MADSDDSPSFVKRSKGGRGVRARPRDADEDVSMGDEPDASPSTLVTKLKNKHKAHQKPKGRLSFGGDEEETEEDVFQVKKSSLSRKMKLSSAAVALPSNLDQASITAQATGPVYSKEYLSQLKAETQSTPAARRAAQVEDVNMSLDMDELAGAIVENIDDGLNGETIIPSESSISAAKEKRERLRTTIVDDDESFISLTVSKHNEGPSGPHPESRLMREEDELGEGDDEYAEYTSAQERIALGKKGKKKEAEKKKESMREMIEDAEDVDEETLEWENEQIRRGESRRFENKDGTPVKEVYRPAPIPPPIPIPSMDVSVARLTQALSDLTLSHSTNTTTLSSLASERHALEEKEKEMRTMVERAETKRSWFAAFRDWVESVATFLDDKFPTLEELEEEHLYLLRERGDMIIKRRLEDDEDDLATFLGTLPEEKQQLVEEVDELGRVVPQKNPAVMRRQRQTDRIARRNRRQVTNDEEGYSTDGTLPPSDEADYETANDKLTSKIKGVLSDVRSEEFRDPSLGVAKWFGQWRDSHSDTYVGAFGGLGMVSAWEFWVRLELVGWDPMEDHRTLDSFAWYGALYQYSRPRDEGMDDDEEPELGTDGDLVSAMISTTVVPRLCKALQGGALDPYSSKHVKRLVDLAEQVELSASADKFEMMLKASLAPFRNAVDTTEIVTRRYLQLNGMHFDPQAIPARRRYLTRQLKLVQNLARWRKYTGEKHGVGELVTKVVVDCMLPVAETGWDVGGQEVLRKVLDTVPTELCPSRLAAKFK